MRTKVCFATRSGTLNAKDKVAYVLAKQLHGPGEILVLAFNRSAAEELKERIARQLGVAAAELKCRVTTFHALGRGIIEETEGRPPQLADWVEHPAGEAKVIEAIIEELLGSNPEFARLWIDLLVLHPKADIPAEAFDTKADHERYLSVRRRKGNATIGTMAGIYVKSLQEQTIVTWLWLHSVEFEYERQIALEDANGAIRHLHPDFYYSASQTIHEHLAINADGSSPFADYVAHAESKRAAYRQAEVDVFETTSAQASLGSLVAELEAELAKRGIPFLLTNSREPSRYIGELSEIAGDNLRFETIDGELLRQCPACRSGHLVERTGPANRRFLGCSQFPNCEHTVPLK